MMTQEFEPDQQARAQTVTEYTASLGDDRATRERGRISSHGLRFVYFSLAAAWGFIAGVAGLLVALSLFDQAVVPTTGAVVALVPALGVAVVGGRVLAGAYEEARRRRR